MKTIQEQFQQELEDFRMKISEMTIDMFNEDHELDPVVFMLAMRKKDKPVIGIVQGLAQLFNSDSDKEIAAELLKGLNKETKPIATAFVSEGWMVVADANKKHELIDEKGRMKIPPSKHPDKIEVVFINLETHNKICHMSWQIIREEGKDPILRSKDTGLWMDKSKNSFAGKFSNLLKDNYSEFAEELKNQLKDSTN